MRLKMTKDEVLQSVYEDKLSERWQLCNNIKEMEITSSGSNLRVSKIKELKALLDKVENQLNVIEEISDEFVSIPDWYREVLNKYNLTDKRLDR